MQDIEHKVIWNVTKKIFIIGFVFWLLETIVFLIIEGWHLKATNPIEINCDKIVVNLWDVCLHLAIYIFINYLIKLNKK